MHLNEQLKVRPPWSLNQRWLVSPVVQDCPRGPVAYQSEAHEGQRDLDFLLAIKFSTTKISFYQRIWVVTLKKILRRQISFLVPLFCIYNKYWHSTQRQWIQQRVFADCAFSEHSLSKLASCCLSWCSSLDSLSPSFIPFSLGMFCFSLIFLCI